MAEPENSFDGWVDPSAMADLGPGPRANRKSLAEVEKIKLPEGEKWKLIRALVLLWNDHHDGAHEISQAIGSADGSYVHGLVHRREPDYGNAKYWFHRVGNHPSFTTLVKSAAALPRTKAETECLNQFCNKEIWDPFVFIDACESPSGQTDFLRRVQAAEFGNLFQHLVRKV